MNIKVNRIGCIIQARMNSHRLFGKVLVKICGKSILEHIIERIKESKYIQEIIIATSSSGINDPIRDLGNKINIPVFSGSEDDVLSRYIEVSKTYNFRIIVRVTADDPLIDIQEADKMIKILEEKKLDYVTNSDISLDDYNTELPAGFQVEVLSSDALLSLEDKDLTQLHREHVTLYIEQYAEKYNIRFIKPRENIRYKGLRLTVDTPEDLGLMNKIYLELYKGRPILNEKVVELIKKNPSLSLLNSSIKTNYSYLDGIRVKKL
ncbi:MAG: glycosyltransferase family protein [Patescibacteria group bacterium]